MDYLAKVRGRSESCERQCHLMNLKGVELASAGEENGNGLSERCILATSKDSWSKRVNVDHELII